MTIQELATSENFMLYDYKFIVLIFLYMMVSVVTEDLHCRNKYHRIFLNLVISGLVLVCIEAIHIAFKMMIKLAF